MAFVSAPQGRLLMNSAVIVCLVMGEAAAPATVFIIFSMTLLLLMVNLNVCISENHKGEIFFFLHGTEMKMRQDGQRRDRWIVGQPLAALGLSLLTHLSNIEDHLYASGLAHRWGEPPPL